MHKMTMNGAIKQIGRRLIFIIDTPAEGPWKSIATPPSTEPQTFAFVKIDLGPCNPLVLDNRLLLWIKCLSIREIILKNKYLLD